MIVYGSVLSPFVKKVLVVANEKGVEAELRPTGPAPGQRSDEFMAASPLGKMPAMADGDFALSDSSAIAHYLDAKYPEPALIPDEPELRGLTIWYEEFADTILASCGAKMFYNRVVMPVFMKQPGDLSAADKAQAEELPPLLDYLERIVPNAGGYMVGDRFTLADIAIACPFANFAAIGCDLDRARHGRLAAYVDAMFARPSFAPAIEHGRRILEKVMA